MNSKVLSREIYLSTFFIILCTAFFLRVYKLESVPSGFHRDEVANAYLGRFVIENGVDIYGNKWPLFTIDKKGDFPPVIPMYVAGLSTKIFGNSIWATRIPFALFGVATALIIYSVALKIFQNNKWIALLSFAIASTMPWQVGFSRIGAEGTMASLFFMIGFWFLVRFGQTPKTHYIFWLSFFWLFTYLIYPSYRITVPLLFSVVSVINWKQKLSPSRFNKYFYFATILSLLLTVIISQSSWGSGRLKQTSWMGAYENGGNPMEQYVMQDKNILTARIFSSKVIFFFRSFIGEYLSYFSPLFLSYDEARPVWFAIPRVGLVGIFGLTLLVVAVLRWPKFLFDTRVRHWYMALIAFLVISPLASALTSEHTPNSHRAFLMSIPISLLAPFALYKLDIRHLLMKKILTTVIVGIVAVESVWLSYNMFVQWNMASSVYRDDGLLQVAQYGVAQKGKYEKMHFFNSGWFPMYYLFADGNYSRSLVGKFPSEFQIKNIGDAYFERRECPSDTWQMSYRSVGQVALFVQKDCKLDKMVITPKFIQNIQGVEKRFSSIALYEVN